MAMAGNNDIFRMLAIEEKLYGTNYSLWVYMIHHVMVTKGLWNIMHGIERCRRGVSKVASTVETVEIGVVECYMF